MARTRAAHRVHVHNFGEGVQIVRTCDKRALSVSQPCRRWSAPTCFAQRLGGDSDAGAVDGDSHGTKRLRSQVQRSGDVRGAAGGGCVGA
jgi:hypothetical protein